MRPDNPPVTRPKVGQPAETDILLENLGARLAERAKIFVSRHDDPVRLRKWRIPWGNTRNLSNPIGEFLVFKRRLGRLESDELPELHHGPAHHKAMLSEALRLFARTSRTWRRLAVVKFQRRFVIERKCIPAESERPVGLCAHHADP